MSDHISSNLWPILLLCAIPYSLWILIRRFDPRGRLSDIPGPPPQSWIQGNLDQLFNPRAWEFHKDIIKKYGSAMRVYGMFGDEQLYVFDPRALHHIVIKEQHIYEESPETLSFNHLAFGPGLLSTLGSVHKKQRRMLNPVFSIKHMRGLIEVFYPIAHELCDKLASDVRSGKPEINVMAWFSRAALEYIGQGGMGHSFNSLDTSKENEYGDAIRMFVPALSDLEKPRRFLPYLANIGPPWLRRLIIDILPMKTVQRMKDIVDVMEKTSVDVVEKKRMALRKGEEDVVRQVETGKDIMSVLLQANVSAKEEDKLSEEELIAQMSVFIFAGHDTTTSALTRILWILAQDPNAQQKLRQEVTQARAANGDLGYDTLMNLPYLDAVCREMMRLYPPVTTLDRIATKDMVLPLGRSIPGELTKDGKPIHEINIKHNTRIIVSILAANRSKDIWGDDAEEWKPERWLGSNIADDQSDKDGELFSSQKKEKAAKEQLPGVYSGMMTFFGGSRACIGFKFSEMEMKLVLSVLLERFTFEPGSEVYWNMTGISSPVVVGQEDRGPQLPLRISLVKD